MNVGLWIAKLSTVLKHISSPMCATVCVCVFRCLLLYLPKSDFLTFTNGLLYIFIITSSSLAFTHYTLDMSNKNYFIVPIKANFYAWTLILKDFPSYNCVFVHRQQHNDFIEEYLEIVINLMTVIYWWLKWALDCFSVLITATTFFHMRVYVSFQSIR